MWLITWSGVPSQGFNMPIYGRWEITWSSSSHVILRRKVSWAVQHHHIWAWAEQHCHVSRLQSIKTPPIDVDIVWLRVHITRYLWFDVFQLSCSHFHLTFELLQSQVLLVCYFRFCFLLLNFRLSQSEDTQVLRLVQTNQQWKKVLLITCF